MSALHLIAPGIVLTGTELGAVVAITLHFFGNVAVETTPPALDCRWLVLWTFHVKLLPALFDQVLGPDGLDLRRNYGVNVFACYETREVVDVLPGSRRRLTSESTIAVLPEDWRKLQALVH